MPVNLFTAVVNSRTPAVNFFNGRLLSGEDLTTEHKSNRAARALLGQAIGSGVVYGFEVSEAADSSTAPTPVLAVTKGLALNRNGGSLLLDGDVEIALTRPTTTTTSATAGDFQACTPVQTGAYVAGAGAYLLTVAPASAAEGLAQVNGLSTSTAPCNTDYKAHGVQFRLIQLPLTQAELSDTSHLQNLIAYKFFAPSDWASLTSNPFGAPPSGFGLMDQLRASQAITDCEVPLATLYWTATSGLVFVDLWSVRRGLAPLDYEWPGFTGIRRVSEAQAMLFEFQDAVESVIANAVNPSTVAVTDNFQFIPAAGVIPITGQGSPTGLDPTTFFGVHASRDIATTDAGQVRHLFDDALKHEPIALATSGKIQLYLVWENLQAVQQGSTNQLAMIFASPYLLYRGIPRIGFGKIALSRFAPEVI